MKHALVTFKKTKAGRQKGAWRFNIYAANGEPLMTSEGYTTKRDAVRGVCALFNALWQVIIQNMK